MLITTQDATPLQSPNRELVTTPRVAVFYALLGHNVVEDTMAVGRTAQDARRALALCYLDADPADIAGANVVRLDFDGDDRGLVSALNIAGFNEPTLQAATIRQIFAEARGGNTPVTESREAEASAAAVDEVTVFVASSELGLEVGYGLTPSEAIERHNTGVRGQLTQCAPPLEPTPEQLSPSVARFTGPPEVVASAFVDHGWAGVEDRVRVLVGLPPLPKPPPPKPKPQRAPLPAPSEDERRQGELMWRLLRLVPDHIDELESIAARLEGQG